MIFAELPVEECAGAVLAHALRNGEIAFKKGRILSAADIEAIKNSGRRTITVARLEADDVGEDAAAAALGALLGADGLRVEAPFTGRVNLYAREGGILRVDAAQVDAINEVDEAITLATLADYAAMEPDQMVATVKIIPFAVQARRARCLPRHRAPGAGPLLPPVPPTQGRADPDRACRHEAGAARQDRRRHQPPAGGDGRRAMPSTCARHTSRAALGEAIQRALSDGAGIVLVMGGSAIIDRRDVHPGRDRAQRRQGPAVRHAGRSRQSDPAGRGRAASRSSACPAARARPSSTASTGCCSA